MSCGPSRPLTAQEVFTALIDAAVAGDLDASGGGVAPETLASPSYLDCSTTLVRRRLIELLGAGYVDGCSGCCPETGLPRQSFLPKMRIQPASDIG